MKTRDTRRQSLLRNLIVTVIALLGLSAALPAAAEARVRVVVKPRVVVKAAPVKTTVVIKPAKPARGKYVWVPGHYVKKPGRPRVWVAGHWRRVG